MSNSLRECRLRLSPTALLGADSTAEARLARPEWLQMFSAFRHYNFRLYFIGLLISVVGVWAQLVAQNWLVLELTDSPLILGQVTFVMAVPVWVLSPWAGVIIDRMSRRTLLIITQVVQMGQAFALAALTFSGTIQVWQIVWLSALRGLTNAFDAPTRQAIMVELVGKEDLSNGIALNSAMFSLARTLGPGIGAVILAVLGTAWAFTINGITFLAILVSLALLRLDRPAARPSGSSPLNDLAEGLRYIWQHKTILALIVIAMVIALFGSNFNTLMPVVARDVLGRDEVAYGMMGMALGIGSIIGTSIVAYLSTRPGRGRRLNQVNLIFPLTLLAFALSKSYSLSLFTLVLVGISFIPQLSLCNMLIQSIIPDEIRGRVMSIYSLVIFGTFPLGALIAGSIAEVLGAPLAIAISAGVVIVIGLLVRVAVPRLAALD
jgi:MFS family permease